MSEQTQFPYRTRVMYGVVTPKDLVWNDKTPLQNHENIWKILEKNLNFAVKKDVWCSIVDIIFFNIKNWLAIARVPSRGVQVLDKSPVMTPIQSAWMVNSGNQRILVCKRNFILHSYGNRKIFIWFTWVQLKKFSFLTSSPPWLENRQSCIIKIIAEFIMQVSLVFSQRRLHEG